MKTGQITASYERDGYWIENSILSGDECDRLKAESSRVLQEHGRTGATVYVGAAAASPVFRELAGDRRIVAVLREIMPGGVAFLSDKIVIKSGAKRFATPWHIDAFYWKNTRPKLSVWIPLDDAGADNGTLVVVRGSHKNEWRPVKTSGPNGEFEQQVENKTWPPADEVVCEVPRGSAVFFSDRLLHASCPNTSGRDRYTIIGTYHAPAEDEPFDRDFEARHVLVPSS